MSKYVSGVCPRRPSAPTADELGHGNDEMPGCRRLTDVQEDRNGGCPDSHRPRQPLLAPRHLGQRVACTCGRPTCFRPSSTVMSAVSALQENIDGILGRRDEDAGVPRAHRQGQGRPELEKLRRRVRSGQAVGFVLLRFGESAPGREGDRPLVRFRYRREDRRRVGGGPASPPAPCVPSDRDRT